MRAPVGCARLAGLEAGVGCVGAERSLQHSNRDSVGTPDLEVAHEVGEKRLCRVIRRHSEPSILHIVIKIGTSRCCISHSLHHEDEIYAATYGARRWSWRRRRRRRRHWQEWSEAQGRVDVLTECIALELRAQLVIRKSVVQVDVSRLTRNSLREGARGAVTMRDTPNICAQCVMWLLARRGSPAREG